MASAKAKIRHVFGDTFSCRAAPPDILVKLSELYQGFHLQGNFPAKGNFWPVQGKGQGNQIYQEMARKFKPGQGNCKEILKIVYIRNKFELKVEIYLQ